MKPSQVIDMKECASGNSRQKFNDVMNLHKSSLETYTQFKSEDSRQQTIKAMKEHQDNQEKFFAEHSGCIVQVAGEDKQTYVGFNNNKLNYVEVSLGLHNDAKFKSLLTDLNDKYKLLIEPNEQQRQALNENQVKHIRWIYANGQVVLTLLRHNGQLYINLGYADKNSAQDYINETKKGMVSKKDL